MPRAEVRVVVLFEDNEHEMFLRALVTRLGLRPVRYRRCVDCSGVLRELPAEVDALRGRKHQRNLGLVVCIDADKEGLDGRRNELLRRIKEQTGEGDRGKDERIALLVPARAIEAWYVHLCVPEARPIDEGRDYKTSPEWRRLEEVLHASAKEAVRELMAPAERGAEPSSITSARAELLRIS